MDKSVFEKELAILDRDLKTKGCKPMRWGYVCGEIKRAIKKPDGKQSSQRMPKKRYKHLGELERLSLVDILNFETDREKKAREQFDIKTAYLPRDIMKGFYDLMKSEIPHEKQVKRNYRYLIKYFIDYFVDIDPNPNEWHRKHVPSWSAWLEKQGLAVPTIKCIIQTVNRFTRYLHKIDSSKFTYMVFEPLTKAKLRQLKAIRPPKERRYIKDDHHELLLTKLSTESLALYKLMYCYGLRLSEACGLEGKLGKIKNGCLVVDEQLRGVDRYGVKTYGPTKNYKSRKVPHWYLTPNECYELASDLLSRTPVEYGRMLSDEIEAILGLRYTPHDCRHTFITRAVNEYPMGHVRLAVGHADLKTLSGYLKDNRDIDDDTFIPE